MITLAFLVGILGVLFVAAYVTGRRFGVLGLALSAGALLSANWSTVVTPFLQQHGVTLGSPPLQFVVQMALLLLPAAVLLFSGPTYKGTIARIASSFGFAMMSVAFLATTLYAVLPLDEPGVSLLDVFRNYASLIVVLGIIGAVVDTLLTSQPRAKKRER